MVERTFYCQGEFQDTLLIIDVALPEKRSHDEVGDLTTSFENMQLALKEYTANLREATAAKEPNS
jgi:nitrogen fixation/metabolism regulation signal transduction histidine kinase